MVHSGEETHLTCINDTNYVELDFEDHFTCMNLFWAPYLGNVASILCDMFTQNIQESASMRE